MSQKFKPRCMKSVESFRRILSCGVVWRTGRRGSQEVETVRKPRLSGGDQVCLITLSILVHTLWSRDHVIVSSHMTRLICSDRDFQIDVLLYWLPNLKGSIVLILAKDSDIRISTSLDISTPSFIPLPCFIRFRHTTPLLDPSLVLCPPRCV